MKISTQISQAAQTIADTERAMEELAAFDFTGIRVSTYAGDVVLSDAANDRLLAAIIVNRETIREIAVNQARADLSDAVRKLKEITRQLEYPIR
mgnify:CR=1 FL=1